MMTSTTNSRVSTEIVEPENDTELLVPVEKSKCLVPRDIIAALIACIGSLIMGFVIGYSSPALESKTFSDFLETQDNRLWFGSLLAIGAIFGGPLGGFLRFIIGLKFTLLLCNLPIGIGWLFILSRSSIPLVFIGRILTGVGVGVVSFAAPLYVAEVADKSRRGVLGLCFQLMITIGILVAYSLGIVLSWNYLALVFLVISFIYCFLLLIIPESPRWFLSQKRNQEALKSLIWLYRSEQRAEIEINFLQNTLSENGENDVASKFTLSILKLPEIYKPILTGMGLMVFQQLSGINAILFYLASIFANAGFQDKLYLPAIIVGSILVIATALSCFVIDHLGRRVLLIVSGLLMTLSMVAFGIYHYMVEVSFPGRTDLNWLSLTSVSVFIASFSIGWSSIPWLATAEIMPMKAKNVGLSITTIINWLFVFIITKEVDDLRYLLKDYGVMWLFASFCVVGVIFVVAFVPETRGKSLEEIQNHFSRNRLATNDGT